MTIGTSINSLEQKLTELAAGIVAENANITATANAAVDAKVAVLVAQITSGVIADGSIATAKIADGAITSAKIAADTITATDIATGAVTTSEIADGTIITADIADSAITSAKIATDTITAADIATGAVTTSEIADGTISSDDIADNAVDNAQIVDNAINSVKIAADAVGASDIAADAVGASEIATDAVGASEIATGAVGTSEIADGSIAAPDIATDTITEYQIATDAVTTSEIADGTVSGIDLAIAMSDAFLEDDLLQPTSIRGMAQSLTGGSIVAASGDQNHPGIITLSTLAVATNSAAITSATNAVRFGGGAARLVVIFRVPTLSDATDTFTVRVGFCDATNAESTDGAFVRYTHGTNSGKFQFVTRNNNVETATDTNINVGVNTWYRVQIDVNAAGTSATCTIFGVSVATNTTNIPTAAGRETGIVPGYIQKSLGANPRTLDIDYFQALFKFTLSR